MEKFKMKKLSKLPH